MRMPFADDLAHHARRLYMFGRTLQAHVTHGVENSPLYRLLAVSQRGDGPAGHHTHGVGQVGTRGVFREGWLRSLGEVRSRSSGRRRR